MFARLWRGIVFSTFLSPVLFLAAMGLGLGGLVKAHTGKVAGLTYLDFVAPGLMAASAMQIAANESMWPVLGGVKWVKNFHATVATSITAGRGRSSATCCGSVLRAIVRFDRVPARRRAARRGAVGVGRARDPGRGAVRGRVRGAARRVLGAARQRPRRSR